MWANAGAANQHPKLSLKSSCCKKPRRAKTWCASKAATRSSLDVAVKRSSTLRAQGVKVTVINGITAGLAGVTSLGVPLTHRAHAHGVLFITGHAKQGATEAMDWVALSHTAAQAKLTLVIYMGMSGAAQLQAAMLHGLCPHTPVAVIQHVSLPTQRHVVCTLSDLHATVVRDHMASPSVIVVGDVLQGLLHISQDHQRFVAAA